MSRNPYPQDKSIPCYGCKGRVLGCHSTCEKYGEYKKKRLAKYEAAREHSRFDGVYETYKAKSISKMRKKRGW